MKRQPERRHAQRAARGLTLIEMLVTLVIVAMVAAILGQALAQLARIERLLESGQLRSASAALRAEWVRDALTALLPAQDSSEQLRGSARELDGSTSIYPQLQASGQTRLRLRLLTDAQGQQTRLELLPPDGAGTAPVLLLSWPGRDGRLRYLDAQGRWHDEWPVIGVAGIAAVAVAGMVPDIPRLPQAIALETGSASLGTLLAQPALSSLSLPSRKQQEGM